jgi:hypothetical protein
MLQWRRLEDRRRDHQPSAEGRRGGSYRIQTRSVTWLGFDKARTPDGTAHSLNSAKSHDKEAITLACIVFGCAVLGWLVGQL